MLNFKKVLLGESTNLDVREQSQWPELGKISQPGNISGRKLRNDIQKNEKNHNSERNNDKDTTDSLQSTPAKVNLPSTSDFPDLLDSVNIQLETRNVLYTINCSGSNLHNTEVNRKSICYIKCKKVQKSLSKAPIVLDVNTMLKCSLTLAERKRQQKRMRNSRRRSLNLQQFAIKNVACGNKLDSDCPIRHKGKKRPHKLRKPTRIKRGFQWAAEKSSTTQISGKCYLTKRMNRLRLVISSGISKGQAIDELVTNLGHLHIGDVRNSNNCDQKSVPLDNFETAKCIVHTKNFRPYCDQIVQQSLKKKAFEFINTLRIYQDKLYARDPISSKSRRRYVCGCHEARKFLRIGSVKLIFIASNVIVDNGRPPILDEILHISKELGLPVIFAGTAMDFGMWTLKKRKTTVITVLNYEGAEKLFNELLDELKQAKENYQTLIENVKQKLQINSDDETSTFLNKNELQGQEDVEEQIMDNIISKLSL